jgi:hypothetical protein
MSGSDDYGDGCNWYAENSGSCGAYDSSNWSSTSACCACGGGNNHTLPAICVDGTGTDAYGDTCDWYSSNADQCGNYDSASFSAHL